jgi:hypothetical protein
MIRCRKLFLTGLATVFCLPLMADTIEKADGSLIEGSYVGGNPTTIMFEVGGEVTAYSTTDVVALFLSAGVQKAQEAPPATAAATVTVPAGTRLMIRTSDTIDSRQHRSGHRFKGQLEGALVVDGTVVAQKGSFIYGHLIDASQARRVAGRSGLVVEFTDINIDSQQFPITTGTLEAQSGSTGGRTARRTARGAVLGGLIGGSSGARTGAKVGAGVSIVTQGESVNIPRGTLVETTLAAPMTVPK